MDDYTLLHGDCLTEMAAMDAGSVDAVVTDPPYGLGFMGKAWDAPDIARRARRDSETRKSVGPHSETRPGRSAARTSSAFGSAANYAGPRVGGSEWQEWCYGWSVEALRVLKPSHYLLAFGGTRTWHRLACAIEDAGFEIRDTLMWMYGSGFPKGKSCLKPAWEPVILARKPGPMRELGIEECRVGTADNLNGGAYSGGQRPSFHAAPHGRLDPEDYTQPSGRWPANLILECTCDETREGTAKSSNGQADYTPTGKQGPVPITRNVRTGAHYGDSDGKEPVRIHTDPNCPCAMLDGQAPDTGGGSKDNRGKPHGFVGKRYSERTDVFTAYPDSGGASRFFYCAKSSRSERNAGCEGMEERARHSSYGEYRVRRCRVCGSKSKPPGPDVEWPACGHGDWEWVDVDPVGCKGGNAINHHPTVKPLALMRWLVKLVAQPGDVVLDPFAGSGTTGVACAMEGREFIGIEREAEYIEIARRRIEHASAQGRLPLDESPPLPPVAGRPT